MTLWMTKTIGEISESCLGKMLDKNKNKGTLQPYLSNKTVRWGSFTLENLSLMRFENGEEDRYGVKKGDLIVCEGGEPGRCAIWEEEVPNMKIQKALHRVRVKEGFDPYFLYYRILHAGRCGELEKYFIGSTIKHLTGVNLKKIQFKFPPYEEQLLISKCLQTIDKKISVNNRINAELEATAKTIYDYWFVQFDFPISKEQAKAMGKPKLEGKPYKASGGKMVCSEELKREVPDGWQVGSLLDIADFTNGIACQKFRPEVAEPSYRVIKIREMGEGFTDSSEFVSQQIPEKVVIRNGDILFSWSATLDVKIWSGGTGALNQHIFKVTSSKYPRSFFYFEILRYLQHFKMIAELRKTTMGHITQDHLKQSRIIIPPLQLIDSIHQIIDPIVNKIVSGNEESQKLAELRDWLLPMLMNGQVRIKETTPSKVVKPTLPVSRPVNSYFSQTQLVAAIVNASEKHKITHSEMTLAKYAYLVDKLYGVPTYFNYERLHLGPYPKEMKKIVNNKKFFKIRNNEVSVVPQGKEYKYQFQKQVEEAVSELASIFNQYKGQERSYQIELLATVCKVVEDIKSTNLKAVRESMKKWPIDLKTSKFKNKAEKFSEEETLQCIEMILHHSWNKFLI